MILWNLLLAKIELEKMTKLPNIRFDPNLSHTHFIFIRPQVVP